jgi:hypothetical protein
LGRVWDVGPVAIPFVLGEVAAGQGAGVVCPGLGGGDELDAACAGRGEDFAIWAEVDVVADPRERDWGPELCTVRDAPEVDDVVARVRQGATVAAERRRGLYERGEAAMSDTAVDVPPTWQVVKTHSRSGMSLV